MCESAGPAFVPGERVQIAEGVFRGLEGIVLPAEGQTQTIRVEVTIFGRQIPLDLEAFLLGAVNPTEAEWLNCCDRHRLIFFLRSFPATQEQLARVRWFVAACLRLGGCLASGEDRSRLLRGVDLVERRADGVLGARQARKPAAEFKAAGRRNQSGSEGQRPGLLLTVENLFRDVSLALGENVWEATSPCSWLPLEGRVCSGRLLHDIFGNPFRPVSADPAWLTWNNGFIPGVAESLHETGRFDELPILADALEDAGCEDQDILDHCRSGGPHVRGCWVVNLLRPDRKGPRRPRP
jgi:hypothetical protein